LKQLIAVKGSLCLKIITLKRITHINKTATGTDKALLVAKIGFGGLMLTHGIPKMMTLFSGAFPPVFGMIEELPLGLAMFAEVFCSLFILAGFATRLAVVPLIISMLIAVLSIHGADPFTEPALHYFLMYVILLFAGSGNILLIIYFKAKHQKQIFRIGTYKIQHSLFINNHFGLE
jgi:putative oxidoreductase